MVLLVGMSVVFGWVYNGTGGSVLIVTLMHCVMNAAMGPVFLTLLTDGTIGKFTVLCIGFTWLVVPVILVRTNPTTLTSLAPTYH